MSGIVRSLTDIPAARGYLARIGAEPRSLKTAVVKEIHGSYWRDIAVIRFKKDGSVTAPDEYSPTPAEQAALTTEFANVRFPELKPLPRAMNLPKELEQADPDDVFEFRNADGNIVMLQLRKQVKGEKSYIPYTYWDDDQWRKMEPEGPLPLWGIEQLKQHTTVFIHEGAKAARAMRRMVEAQTDEQKQKLMGHPWGEELQAAAHIGWIGGALSPHRTDWSVLLKEGVKRAYIVSDNDAPGVAAVSSIAYHLKVPTFHIQFTNEWPASFDMADSWPQHMFKELEGTQHYIGPSFKSCLHPATWATDLVPNPKGKPSIALRETFKDMWAYAEEADLFVCIEMPDIVRNEQIMNNMLSAFSHTNAVSKLLLRSYRGRSVRLAYRPNEKGKMVTDKTTSAINLHTPTHIKSKKGNPKPFLDFIDYMFPNPKERKEVLRWCATLIARPDLRMEYGLLLVSETQGVGKTTLGSSILAPLVGPQNVSYPTELTITQSDFNDWSANKRLVIVNEIYSGHSWKAYNRLKSIITDTQVEVNQKYQRRYTIENWCHIFACSNSLRALRMEEDDRRWFYPEVTEVRWPRERFEALHNWLKGGGLSIIKYWAEHMPSELGRYVMPGDRAPMTLRKKDLIAESRTEAQSEVADLAEAINHLDELIAITMKDLVAWVRSSVQGRVFDSDYELRKAMRDAGALIYPKRVKVAGRLQYMVLNANAEWQRVINEEDIPTLLKHIKKPGDLFGESM